MTFVFDFFFLFHQEGTPNHLPWASSGEADPTGPRYGGRYYTDSGGFGLWAGEGGHAEEAVVELHRDGVGEQHEEEVEKRSSEEVLVCAVGWRPAGGPRRAGGISSRGNRPLPLVVPLRPGTALAGERERRLVGTPTRATMAAVILVPLRDTVHRPRPLSPTPGPRRRRPVGALAPREERRLSTVA